jgi:hypothetical protein
MKQQWVTPWTLKVADFFKSNFVVSIIATIIATIIFALTWRYFTLLSDQNTQKNRVDDLKIAVNELSKKYDSVTTLDKNLSVFKAGVEKYLEFIKYKLNQINK